MEEKSEVQISSWDSNADNIFESLQTIGALQPRDRFGTRSGPVVIQKPATTGISLIRMWNGENRHENIQDIGKILDEAFLLADRALREREKFPVRPENEYKRDETLHIMRNKQLLNRIVKDIQMAKHGLEQWKETYPTDTATQSKITLLIEKTNNRLEQVEKSIQILETQRS